ncbi:hypothetical protein PanNE5_33040 [Pandoraea sp. NE5]|nr:hypothetical protein PanNE5_33040 [Pandoraea sp. NE5]
MPSGVSVSMPNEWSSAASSASRPGAVPATDGERGTTIATASSDVLWTLSGVTWADTPKTAFKYSGLRGQAHMGETGYQAALTRMRTPSTETV